MEPTLDNRMIFGGLGNLRLAPHVREGRGVSGVSSLRPAAEPAGSTVAGSRPGAAGGFVGAERITISPQARAAYEASAGAPASEEATATAPAPAPIASSMQAALAAAAYGASLGSTDPVAAAPSSTPGSGPALATALYA